MTMTKKAIITFLRKKYRVTLSVTAPGDTNVSDATVPRENSGHAKATDKLRPA